MTEGGGGGGGAIKCQILAGTSKMVSHSMVIMEQLENSYQIMQMLNIQIHGLSVGA